MPGRLQIVYPRERALVGLADLLIRPLGWRRSTPVPTPSRILLLRLERIGDLLMVRRAIADARRHWPSASIDLAVGSWNAPIAQLIPDVSHVETLDVPWLARGARGDRWSALIGRARSWRGRYDLVINFEPDIRSNALAWLTGAPARVGYRSGGGGSLLTAAADYVPEDHVSINARRLVARAAGRADEADADILPAGAGRHADSAGLLAVPAGARAAARQALAGLARPLVGVHAAGGRESKQWHLERFAAAARGIAEASGGTIVLTGGPGDRPLVDRVAAHLAGAPMANLCGAFDLVDLAALLAELDVLVTGDTGPMHLAAAVGTRVVALFGPSDPRRYGPLGEGHRVLRVDLPCSPCHRVRMPPARCRGHVPDCLDQIAAERVVAAALDVLRGRTGG